MATDFKSIPVIDVSPLLMKCDDPRMTEDLGALDVIRQLDRACREAGFFYVKGHGIPDSLIKEVRKITHQFFHLPQEDKLQIKLSSDTGYRGYQEVGDNVTKGVPDKHEAIDFYTLLETAVVSVSLFPQFIAFFSDGEIAGTPTALATTFLAFVLNLAFSLSVFGFMVMHMSLVAANTTTIEAYGKKTSPKWRFDLGRKKNFQQVFGTDKRYWFVPAYTEEDLRRMPELQGLDYPSKPELDSQGF